MAGVIDLMVWSENPLLLFPLAVLSAAGVVMILTLVYTIVWTLIAKQDNRFTSVRQVWMALLAGFLTALLQIAVIDAGRYWFTGTWGGFNL
jgi:asparagine N-glycosylation enzyme membrane subunit Stt3